MKTLLAILLMITTTVATSLAMADGYDITKRMKALKALGLNDADIKEQVLFEIASLDKCGDTSGCAKYTPPSSYPYYHGTYRPTYYPRIRHYPYASPYRAPLTHQYRRSYH